MRSDLSSYAVGAALIGCIAGIVVAPVGARILTRRFDPFEPIVLFAVAYGVMFVLRPAAMLLEDSLVYEGPREALDVSETFGEMLVVALLGAAAFTLAYSLAVGRRLAARLALPREARDRRRLLTAAAAVGLVGFLSYIVVIASFGFAETISAILRADSAAFPELTSATMYASFLFLFLTPAALVCVAAGTRDRSLPVVAVGVAMALLVLVFSLPLGSRITLLPLLGGLYVLYYVQRSARPRLSSIVALLAIALVVSAFLSDLRGRGTRDESVGDTVSRTLSASRLADSLTSGPDTDIAPVLAAALGVIPERLAHTYGRTIFGDLVLRPVPRSLWEGKPIPPKKELLATVWPIEYERGTINSEASPLAYFYWDFNLPGVALGMALYGLLARLLYEYFRQNGLSLYAQVLYALAIWFVVIGVRDGPVDTFVRAGFTLIPLWVIFALASRTQRTLRAPSLVRAEKRATP